MQQNFNLEAFNHIDMDSSAIGPLDLVGHPLAKSGTYEGTVIRNGKAVGTFTVTVTDDEKNQQVDIDLSYLGGSGPTAVFTVQTGGFVLFYSSHGPHRYAASLHNRQTGRLEFSSKVLKAGDVYAPAPIRLGVYELANTRGKTKPVQITVGERLEPFTRGAEGPDLTVTDQGIQSKPVTMIQTQRMFVAMETTGRMVMKLVKGDRSPVGRKRQ